MAGKVMKKLEFENWEASPLENPVFRKILQNASIFFDADRPSEPLCIQLGKTKIGHGILPWVSMP